MTVMTTTMTTTTTTTNILGVTYGISPLQNTPKAQGSLICLVWSIVSRAQHHSTPPHLFKEWTDRVLYGVKSNGCLFKLSFVVDTIKSHEESFSVHKNIDYELPTNSSRKTARISRIVNSDLRMTHDSTVESISCTFILPIFNSLWHSSLNLLVK